MQTMWKGKLPPPYSLSLCNIIAAINMDINTYKIQKITVIFKFRELRMFDFASTNANIEQT